MYAGADKYGGAVVGEGQPTESTPVSSGLSLEETIDTAAAEETVVVDVPYSYLEDEDDPDSAVISGTSHVLLSAQLNPEAGGLMWVEQENPQNTYKNVVAMSQMTSMLRDLDRNSCYEQGIKLAIERFTQQHGRAPIVLDIGTGTGLLSMFAATHGAQHVYACEMFTPMAEIAENVTAANHADKITVFPIRSTDLVVGSNADGSPGHLPQRADMLVSELFDSILLGEAVIPTIRHAREHLLTKDAVVVPERATVFAHVVQNEPIYRLNSFSGQYLNEQKARLARNDAAWDCTGAHPTLPLHVQAFDKTSTKLTESVPVLAFDFTTATSAFSSSVNGSQETVVTALADGCAHAVIMWWEVSFDAENTVMYSTKPGAQNWQDHWVPVVFPLTNQLQVTRSDAVVLRAHHDDLHIWFEVDAKSSSDEVAKKQKLAEEPREKTPCTCGLHLICNAERIAMLTDTSRIGAFNSAIAKAIATLKKGSADRELSCLDISDGSLCALLAATQGVQNITSIESKDVSARIYQQILDAHEGVEAEVMCCGCKGLLPEHLKGEKRVELLVGEPFFYSMQNLPLWQAFNFWLRRSAVADLLAEDALIVPASARVCALAVQFEHLHECFGAVGNVSGYDHSFFDQYQDEYYRRNFPFPVYMYPYTPVSGVLELAKLDFTTTAHTVHEELSTTLAQAPNAVVVWMEYSLDQAGEFVVATGPAQIHSKQLVRFLPVPADVKSSSTLSSRFTFDSLEGTIDLDFAIEQSS